MLDSIFEDLHAKRLESLANYSVGAMQAVREAIHAIGAAYAEVAGLQPKNGVKQVVGNLSSRASRVEELVTSGD